MLAKDLIKHAVEAQNNAQAKYSKFYVGCALLSDNDECLDSTSLSSSDSLFNEELNY